FTTWEPYSDNSDRRSAGELPAERSHDRPTCRWATSRNSSLMATKAIVGEKVGMTQIWDDDSRVVPVTVVQVQPMRIVDIKTPERDGYSALQVTYGTKKASKLTRPVAGQYAAA